MFLLLLNPEVYLHTNNGLLDLARHHRVNAPHCPHAADTGDNSRYGLLIARFIRLCASRILKTSWNFQAS